MSGPRALVLGRMPPEGRDLDLLVRTADLSTVTQRLEDEEYAERGGRWVRFRDCDVDVVDVVDVASWQLPPAEVDDLFAAAEPVAVDDGPLPLARPAPAHVVLIEARRWAAGGLLTELRRARVDEALRSGDDVWAEVVRRSPAWHVDRALPALRGEAPLANTRRRVARRVARSRGRVVTFSGVDGSGKSSQAAALVAALDRLGYPAVTVWTRITINPSLDVIARPVKRVLGLARRSSAGRSADGDRSPGHGAASGDAARAFRLRHPTVNHTWLLVVAVVNAAAQWRAVAPHLAKGRVVVCDRYTPDSAAHLRYKYGPKERYRLQSRVIRLLSPRPLRSYFLDVPGAVAHARKPEKYTAEHLERLAELYREECAWLGVRRLDGDRPRPELCATVADDVLDALLGARQRGRRRRSTR